MATKYLRQLKKREKKAVRRLMVEFGYKPSDFTPSDGRESIAAPPDAPLRYTRNGFLHPGPLKGTPIFCKKIDYYSDDRQETLPSELLYDERFAVEFERVNLLEL